MSSDPWTLDPDAEREILLTWQQGEPDHDVQAKVLLYLADLRSTPGARLWKTPTTQACSLWIRCPAHTSG